jgi:predicted dehydrogenase
MLNLAIVGVGWAGERQVQAVRELNGDVHVMALGDNDAEFLKAKAAELGISRTYTDYAALLRDSEIHAVSICTPHHLHCPMAIQAAEAGKHVLVEKPMAMTVADATRMLEAADRNRVRLYVAENLPYRPIAAFLRNVVATGSLVGALAGAAFAGGFRAANFGYPGRRAWLTQPGLGGTGTWMLHGIHTIAQLRYIFGEVASVYMREHHAPGFERTDIEGTMTGVLGMDSGIHITIVQTCEVVMSHRRGGYTLFGERGTLHAHNDGYDLYSDGESTSGTYPPAALSDYALEIAAFGACVLHGTEGPTTGLAERRSLAVVEAGYLSAASGQPIVLRDQFGVL